MYSLHASTETHSFHSIFPPPHDIYLHPSLILSCLRLVKAMRTNFYRGLSDTEDDGGGLQWDLISRCWISYTKVWGAIKRPQPGGIAIRPQVHTQKVWGAVKRPQPWGIAARPQIHKKKGRQNVWSTIIIKPSGPYIFPGIRIDNLSSSNLTSF